MCISWSIMYWHLHSPLFMLFNPNWCLFYAFWKGVSYLVKCSAFDTKNHRYWARLFGVLKYNKPMFLKINNGWFYPSLKLEPVVCSPKNWSLGLTCLDQGDLQGGPKKRPHKLSKLTQYRMQFFLTKQYKILNCYSFAVKPHLSCNFIFTKSTVIRS